MVRHALASFSFVVSLSLGRGPGCGDVDDPHGGPNAPCTRSSDCEHRLVCLEGVCREADAGAAATDAGSTVEDAGDGGD